MGELSVTNPASNEHRRAELQSSLQVFFSASIFVHKLCVLGSFAQNCLQTNGYRVWVPQKAFVLFFFLTASILVTINTSARTNCENRDQFGATNLNLQEVFSFCPLICPHQRLHHFSFRNSVSGRLCIIHKRGFFFSVQQDCRCLFHQCYV